MDFDVRKTNRRCSATERELKPGETFYSVLLEDPQGMRRVDFCEEAWSGPPEDCVGWWKTSIPEIKSDRVYWAPVNIRLAYFEQLLSGDSPTPENQNTAYVLALLLVRQRILQLSDTTNDEKQDQPPTLTLHREKKTYHVPVCDLNDQQVALIQQQLADHLFLDHPPESE